MAENTKIQWCHHTFNPWIGCSKINEGCQNCYAENLMDTRYHRVKWGPQGTRSRTKTWNGPLKWNRAAKLAGEKRKVFCASLADVFEDREELVPWRKELFTLIDRCPDLYWLLLTKRPENISRMWEGPSRSTVWLGTSIANQKNADVYIDRLLEAERLCSVLFLSIEPQIGAIDLTKWLDPLPLIGWVIVGGESDQGSPAREFRVEWATKILSQCREGGVPCFIKQLGSRISEDSNMGRVPLNLVDKHGGDWWEWPEDLRVRECPETYNSLCLTL